MARRFQNRQMTRSNRPNRTWSGVASPISIAVPANSAVLLATFVLNNQGIDETWLRTRGSFYVSTDTTGSSEEQIGAFGLVLATDTALAVGITALPDPVTEIEDDGWFVYVPIQQDSLFSSAVGQIIGHQYDFDSKAKRVVETGTGAAVVVANAHASHAFKISFGFRLLAQVRGTR